MDQAERIRSWSMPKKTTLLLSYRIKAFYLWGHQPCTRSSNWRRVQSARSLRSVHLRSWAVSPHFVQTCSDSVQTRPDTAPQSSQNGVEHDGGWKEFCQIIPRLRFVQAGFCGQEFSRQTLPPPVSFLQCLAITYITGWTLKECSEFIQCEHYCHKIW